MKRKARTKRALPAFGAKVRVVMPEDYAELQTMKLALAQRQVNEAITMIDNLAQLVNQAKQKNPGAIVQLERLGNLLREL